MNVYALPSIDTAAPQFARNEPNPPVFSGSPAEVADYLTARLATRTHTMALIAAELRVMARDGMVNDAMRLQLADRTSLTIRP
jgi:hypothetical protein